MNIRTLGSTALAVSHIGLGLTALGRPGYINLGHARDLADNYDVSVMEKHTHQILDAAWLAGICYFDAARSYGRAEDFLGDWLRKRRIEPDAVTVGSKWGYTYTAGWSVDAKVHEVKEHTLAVLRRQWEESRLCLDPYLRLYQIHSATLDSGVFDNRGVLAELAHLKSQGRYVGLSVSGPGQVDALKRAAEIQVDGVRLFDSVQITWNLLETSTAHALQEARADGMGVIVKETLANGRLTNRNNDPKFASKRALLEQQAARLNTSLDALAIAAALAQPWADTVLSGAATVTQFVSNMKALDVQWDEEASTTLAHIAEPPDVYWTARKDLAWN